MKETRGGIYKKLRTIQNFLKEKETRVMVSKDGEKGISGKGNSSTNKDPN